MKIEPMMSVNRLDQRSAVETLESRVVRASGNALDVNGSKRPGPDPEFDELYRKLLAMEGQGEQAIFLFLKSQLNPDGTPAYPNPKAIMAVTHKLLLRLKDEQLEKSLLYKEIKGANARAFSIEIFISSFMRDVFQPMGDDSWEKSEW
ncbi:hypothetical protein KJF94_05960 [Pseudomonas hormoni]|uniref:Uncharacterized protein n=1 Tax=Pseudomonas hormoni TaxID=3093767 RepID=A0ABX8F2S2_9PSED|nr:hypothetical protein [Pseudomonas hormoni]QVW25128.1 hypothetical protein KJF94_05960 [Pseudomonas hormoni]